MNIKKLGTDFAITFVLTLAVSILVTYLYSLVVHGSGVVDWEASFRLAIIFGIVIPWLHQREKNRNA
jgi:hypothetical protein